MLTWGDIVNAIRQNKEHNYCVENFKPSSALYDVDTYTLEDVASAPIHVSPPKSDTPATIAPPLPPPPKVTPKPQPAAVAATGATGATAMATVKSPVVNVINAAPVRPASTINEPRTMKYEVDPIVIGIENFECLYDSAPNITRKQMECTEAQRIELLLNDLYKSQGGRSRGWTKAGLETLLKPRCASGGDTRELDRAKRAFPWPIIDHDKLASAFLDFLCVAKKIRVAVWYVDEKRVIVYPAADQMDPTDDTTGGALPLYHVNCSGKSRTGFRNIKDFLKFCADNKYTLLPPTSVMSSLSGLTLGELESVGLKLGMTAVEGNKAERVAKIASYKLMSRLQHA